LYIRITPKLKEEQAEIISTILKFTPKKKTIQIPPFKINKNILSQSNIYVEEGLLNQSGSLFE
jgi:hypothetical protein